MAKALEGAAADVDLSNSPTLMSESASGTILGTTAYMSPEQAKGAFLDRRTDIFAFGAVLYEMLTGGRTFPGDTVSEILAAVIRAEPDWSKLPSDIPIGIRRLLARCLQKDRSRRLRDIADARFQIEESVSDAGGLFAGVSLDGSVVSIDGSANSRVYGKEVSGEQILLGKGVQSNATVEPFLNALEKAAPPHVHEKKVTQRKTSFR